MRPIAAPPILESSHGRAAVAATVGVGAPALLRLFEGVGPPHLLPLVATALVIGAVAAGGAARRRCRRWLRDGMQAIGISIALAVLWSIRHPGAVDAATVTTASSLLSAAFAEEAVYRGWIPWMLARPRAPAVGAAAPGRPDRWRPAVASSLIFAFAHPVVVGPDLDIPRLVTHFAVGMLLLALRGSAGSLVAPTLAHAGYNGAVTLAMQ